MTWSWLLWVLVLGALACGIAALVLWSMRSSASSGRDGRRGRPGHEGATGPPASAWSVIPYAQAYHAFGSSLINDFGFPLAPAFAGSAGFDFGLVDHGSTGSVNEGLGENAWAVGATGFVSNLEIVLPNALVVASTGTVLVAATVWLSRLSDGGDFQPTPLVAQAVFDPTGAANICLSNSSNAVQVQPTDRVAIELTATSPEGITGPGFGPLIGDPMGEFAMSGSLRFAPAF